MIRNIGASGHSFDSAWSKSGQAISCFLFNSLFLWSAIKGVTHIDTIDSQFDTTDSIWHYWFPIPPISQSPTQLWGQPLCADDLQAWSCQPSMRATTLFALGSSRKSRKFCTGPSRVTALPAQQQRSKPEIGCVIIVKPCLSHSLATTNA